MGLLDKWRQKARATKAAEELWDVVRRGILLEIPLVFDQSDVTMQAIAILTQQHPQVELRYMLAKGLVLGIHTGNDGKKFSREALEMLHKGGNLKSGALSVEQLLTEQEAWLRSQGMDPAEQEKKAQEERMAREAISVSGAAK
jgi:hypothetical protein